MSEAPLKRCCRACLIEAAEFQSIFTSDTNSGLNIHVAEMIMAYASVQITLGDGLPEQICTDCARKAVDFYTFKLRCEKSDFLLRQQLGKSPAQLETDEILSDHFINSEPDAMPNDIVNVIVKPEIDLQDDSQYDQRSGEEFVNGHRLDHSADKDLCVVSDENVNCETVFVCRNCNLQFFDENTFKIHKVTHVTKRFACDTCSRTFSREDLLLRHKIIHAVKMDTSNIDRETCENISGNGSIDKQKENIRCLHCNITVENNDKMIEHITAEHSSKDENCSFNCKICGKKFYKVSHLTRHMKIHAPVKPHACELCNKSFARSEQLINHLNAHSGIKPHVCNICSKGFNQISNLKDHMRTHNGEKPFLCSTCGKGFNQLGNLRQHTIRHSGIKAHLCSTCGSGFASKGELCAHLRKHTGARPFVCPVCNSGFTTSSSLTKHKRIHSGEKPYTCEVCFMKFSRSGILARHKRTHTGEKPYVCKFCSKAFSQSNDLSSHLRIHTGEKPFICDACGQAFRQSSALKTHKKTHMERNSLMLDSKPVISHSIMAGGAFLSALQ